MKQITIRHVGRFRYAITKQTHRGEKFSNASIPSEFHATNGVELYSISFPDAYRKGRKLFVAFRGTIRSLDKEPLEFKSRQDVYLFKAAIREYNDVHGSKR